MYPFGTCGRVRHDGGAVAGEQEGPASPDLLNTHTELAGLEPATSWVSMHRGVEIKGVVGS